MKKSNHSEFIKDLYCNANLDSSELLEKNKYHAILTITDKDTGEIKNQIIHADTKVSKLLYLNRKSSILVPLFTYCGKTIEDKHRRQMCAFVVTVKPFSKAVNIIENLFNENTVLPTYAIIKSQDVDLYFIFTAPIAAYENKMYRVTRALSVILSKFSVEANGEHVTIAKINTNPREIRGGCVYRIGGFVDIDKLNISLFKYCNINYLPSICTIDEAKTMYPDWYRRTVIQKKKNQSGTRYYITHEKLYEWWKNRINTEKDDKLEERCAATAIYGKKCNIPMETVYNDITVYLQSRGYELLRASLVAKVILEYRYNNFAYKTTRDTISLMTGIDIVSKTHRNGRTSKEHGKYLAQLYKEKLKNDPTAFGCKVSLIAEWREQNPLGNQSECARELGISRTTVCRWWKTCREESPRPAFKRKKQKATKQLYCKNCGMWINKTYAKKHIKRFIKKIDGDTNIICYIACPKCSNSISILRC